MLEWLIIGILIGSIAVSIICQWFFRKEIEYKAESGIDMCLRGRFYTIKRNFER